MKTFILFFLIFIQASVFSVDFSYSINAKQYANDADRLEKRLSKLERRTKKLQKKMNTLKLHNPCQCKNSDNAKKTISNDEDLPRISCFLQTAFKTYTATGQTKIEATGEVLTLCNNDRALGCKQINVECDN